MIGDIHNEPDENPNNRDLFVNEVEYKGEPKREWAGKIPVLFDRANNTLHVGQDGYDHGDIQSLAGHLLSDDCVPHTVEAGPNGLRTADPDVAQALSEHLGESVECSE